jgi:hypothetical protein
MLSPCITWQVSRPRITQLQSHWQCYGSEQLRTTKVIGNGRQVEDIRLDSGASVGASLSAGTTLARDCMTDMTILQIQNELALSIKHEEMSPRIAMIKQCLRLRKDSHRNHLIASHRMKFMTICAKAKIMHCLSTGKYMHAQTGRRFIQPTFTFIMVQHPR